VQALSLLKHRIGSDSVIALLQNGMGIYDELCAQIWPEPATRPFFILGTTTHGVTATERRGEVIHTSIIGEGDIKWGLVPDPRKTVDLESWVYGGKLPETSILSPPETPSLPIPLPPASNTDLGPLHKTISALLSFPSLNSTLLPIPHLHHTLLLKVALNATINPLTAIIGAGSLPNGSLIGSSPSHRLIRMLSDETSAIIIAYLGSLHAPNPPPPDVTRLYTREALIQRTLALCRATSGNTSSMAADTRNARMTEIDHINGYLIQLADRLNVPAPHHRMLREMVKFTTEVTGLRKDTSLGTRTRLTRRRMEIDSNVRSTSNRQQMFDEIKLERQIRQDTRRDRSRHKFGLSEKRREIQNADDATTPSDPMVLKARKAAERTERKLNPTPVDNKVHEDMLAHLDELAESVRPADDEVSSAEGLSDARKVEEKAQIEGSEAEQEAIKALEDRILGGSSRFGKRRF
jgi:2-dehydropantoate 2-reductase